LSIHREQVHFFKYFFPLKLHLHIFLLFTASGCLLSGVCTLVFVSGPSAANSNLLPSFWAAVILNGAGWGIGLSVIGAATASLFGTKSYARNVTMVSLSVAIASYTVVTAVNALKTTGQGLHSFETGLWIIFVFSILMNVPVIWLSYRWKTSFFDRLPLNRNPAS
jgi:uncharacterized membrane-anchored protein YitT (DUF2179 family)